MLFRSQFTLEFGFPDADSRKLHRLIVKMKNLVKLLETKTKLLPKSWLLEERCRFLSNFSQQTIDIALPGEFLLPKIGCFHFSFYATGGGDSQAQFCRANILQKVAGGRAV